MNSKLLNLDMPDSLLHSANIVHEWPLEKLFGTRLPAECDFRQQLLSPSAGSMAQLCAEYYYKRLSAHFL